MRLRSTSTIFALFFSAAVLTAQTATPAPTSAEAARLAVLKARTEASLFNSCPVRLTVDRQPQGGVAWVSSSNPAHRGQGLSISIGNSANRIVAVDITVHGYSAGMRVIPAAVHTSKDMPESREMTETFHLTAHAGEPLLDSPIQTEHLATVDRIELTRIAYADGSEWQPSANSRCDAAPSLFVLVGATAR